MAACDTCPQAANHCAYFAFETVLKFYNLRVWHHCFILTSRHFFPDKTTVLHHKATVYPGDMTIPFHSGDMTLPFHSSTKTLPSVHLGDKTLRFHSGDCTLPFHPLEDKKTSFILKIRHFCFILGIVHYCFIRRKIQKQFHLEDKTLLLNSGIIHFRFVLRIRQLLI